MRDAGRGAKWASASHRKVIIAQSMLRQVKLTEGAVASQHLRQAMDSSLLWWRLDQAILQAQTFERRVMLSQGFTNGHQAFHTASSVAYVQQT
jgi:hypothetical protein